MRGHIVWHTKYNYFGRYVHVYCFPTLSDLTFFIHLGSQGEVDTTEDRQRELVRQRLKVKEVSQVFICSERFNLVNLHFVTGH